MAKYFNKNLKYIRQEKKISQQELANKIGADRSTISRWENNEIETPLDMAIKIADVFNIPYYDFFGKDLKLDSTEVINKDSEIIKVPVYGNIKAGIPIENQSDIVDYIDIPKNWTKGKKEFFGLKISDDSMYPKYQNEDIVIFEKTNDSTMCNGKDCAIMINGTESTFKKVLINNRGIVLQPFNNNYDIMIFSKDEINQLPVKIIGIAREKRTKIN